jgi:low affinity Fe/Cu permease
MAVAPLGDRHVLLYVALWLIFDPGSFGWHGVAVTATLLMTLFIQRSEHRDTQAVHAKLDELLRANGEARNKVADLTTRSPSKSRSSAVRRGEDRSN